MLDKFKSYTEALNSPPSHLNSVMPSDVADLPNASRGLNVTTSGMVRVTSIGGETADVFVVAGGIFPIRAKRIWATGTTATGIVSLF